jgi:hypothetical protein
MRTKAGIAQQSPQEGNQSKLETGAVQDCIHRLESFGIERLLVRVSGHHDDHQPVEPGVLTHYRDEFLATDPGDANIDDDGTDAILTDRARCADGTTKPSGLKISTSCARIPSESAITSIRSFDFAHEPLVRLGSSAGMKGDFLTFIGQARIVLLITREMVWGTDSPNADPPTSTVDFDAQGQTTDKSVRLLDGKFDGFGTTSESGAEEAMDALHPIRAVPNR